MASIKQLCLEMHQRAEDIKQTIIDYHASCPDKKKRDDTQILVQTVMLYLDIVVKTLLYRKDICYPDKLNMTLFEAYQGLEGGVLEWGGSVKHPSEKNHNYQQSCHFAIINAGKVINELIHQLGGTNEIGTV